MRDLFAILRTLRLPLAFWASLLVVVAGLSAWRPIRSNDAFWHMMLGRAVLDHGSRTVPEPSAMAAFSDARVVPEWLWGVVTYLLDDFVGSTSLTLLLMLLAAVSVLALVKLLSDIAPEGQSFAVMLTSALVLVAFINRFHLRPQSAFLVILPIFLWGIHKYVAAPEDKRFMVLLVALQILWAQLHGSFVLGPVLFALLAVSQLLQKPRVRSQYLSLFLLLLAGSLTSAHGVEIGSYILHHSGGYATSTIQDMQAPTWASIDPSGSARNAAYCLLWILGALGVLISPRARPQHVALALFGLALFATAVRFIAASAILLSPLAVQGAVTLFSQPGKWTRGIASAIVLALAVWKGYELHNVQGPLGEVGFGEGRFPVKANLYLATLNQGSNVFTSYITGAPIGYWQHGHVKTYVDSRTPLHFDNTDMAMAQQATRHADVLALTLRRYGATAAVVERGTVTCNLLSAIWHPVVVEPRFTTFAPGAATSQTMIEACGMSYLSADACRAEGKQLDAEIVRLESLGQTPFTRFLRAARLIKCGGNLARVDELMPERRLAWSYRDRYDLLDAERLLQRGHTEQALHLLDKLAAKGNPYATGRSMELFHEGTITASEGRRVLERFVDAWRPGPQTAPIAHANLALLCLDLGDVECVRFHGLQAAVRGNEQGPIFLKWLRKTHPVERVREDAAAWLHILENTNAEKGIPAGPN